MSDRETRSGQRQDSLTEQMRDLLRFGDELGCRDAVDWIRRRWDNATTTELHARRKKFPRVRP